MTNCIVLGDYEFHIYPAYLDEAEPQPQHQKASFVIEGDIKPVEINEGEPGYNSLCKLLKAFVKLYDFIENIEDKKMEATEGIQLYEE